jgi:hypothetical protein
MGPDCVCNAPCQSFEDDNTSYIGGGVNGPPLHARLNAFASGFVNTGCSYYYEVTEWEGNATQAVFADPVQVRVWVCGTYQSQGPWREFETGYYVQVLSPTFKYGSCGPQADDAGSAIIYSYYQAWNTYVSIG